VCHTSEVRPFTLRFVLSSLLALMLVAPACQKDSLTAAIDAGSDAQCRAVNEVCSSWSDCCSGVCGQGTCLGAGGSGGDASVDAAGTPPWRPSACDQPETGQIPNTDQATVANLVVGKWFDCGPLSMFQTSDDIGVEIVNDGTWYKLYWSGTDVVRGVGFGKLGTWTANSGGICCTVTLNVQGAGGGVAFFPAFATSPKKMQVETSGGGFQTTLATDGN
jgi:hypothetical protein